MAELSVVILHNHVRFFDTSLGSLLAGETGNVN